MSRTPRETPGQEHVLARMPSSIDPSQIAESLRLTPTGLHHSEVGDVDLLGELTGVGSFEQVVGDAEPMDLYGHVVRVAGLDVLARNKRALGRAKDLLDIEAIAESRKRRFPS